MPREEIPLPAPSPLPVPAGMGAALHELGVVLSPAQLVQLGDYLARLLAMNEHMNLTAITDPEQAWQRHVLDALTLCPLLRDLAPGARLLDVGSGGGIPGIPLAIARPDLRVTLIEATQKKAAFLRAVVEALGLHQVEVLAERAERLTSGALRGSFDVVSARAVAKLDALMPLTAPFAKPGAHVLLIKGASVDDELARAAKTLARFHCTHERTITTRTGRVVVLRLAA